MKLWLFVVFGVATVSAACGTYMQNDAATPAPERVRVLSALECSPLVTATATDDATAATPAGTTSTPPSEESATAVPDATKTPRDDATGTPEAACPTATVTETPPSTPIPAVTATMAIATPTARLESTPAIAATETLPTATGTSAVATASARASQQRAYLSVGDGIQWGCCGPLSSSASMLFRDYLEQRTGRPVIWQTSGAGYDTTDTFINGNGVSQPQLDFAVELIRYYRREAIPVDAITLSIGGNNLVEIGNNCPDPPCVDAFVAGLQHLRDQLHVIYSRIAAEKDPATLLMVLLYYDANQCLNPASGAAVDAWNAVIAEVATQYGALLVDARSAFRGHCDWFDANGLDANAAGHAAIAAEYRRVYESATP